MDHAEMNIVDENTPNMMRKKSSFLRVGSYGLFHVTEKSKEDTGNDDNHHPHKKLSKGKNENGLKELLFLHKTSCELPSIAVRTSSLLNDETKKLSLSSDITSTKLSKPESIDQTIVRNHLFAQTDQFAPKVRKQVFINTQPQIRTNSHRRQNHFTIACSTILAALIILTTIIIYVIIMTLNHKIQVNRLSP